MNKTSFLFLFNLHLEVGDSSKQVVSNKGVQLVRSKIKIKQQTGWSDKVY